MEAENSSASMTPSPKGTPRTEDEVAFIAARRRGSGLASCAMIQFDSPLDKQQGELDKQQGRRQASTRGCFRREGADEGMGAAVSLRSSFICIYLYTMHVNAQEYMCLLVLLAQGCTGPVEHLALCD